MKTMTATQAARNFAGLLDAVERGEAVMITRDGVTVGRFVPERRTSADRLKDALRASTPDAEFADDVQAARARMRELLTGGVRGWPGE